MKKISRNPFVVFALTAAVTAMVLIFVRINLFDSEIHYQSEVSSYTVPVKLHLGAFFGINVTAKDLEGVKSFNLTKTGYLLVFLMIIGFPALIAYRVWLAGQPENQHKKF